MPQGLSSLVKISDVVKETLWMAERDDSFYKRFYQHCINGYRELSQFHIADNIRTVKKTMDTNYMVSFPDDMLQWLKVSISVNGVKVSLTHKRDLVNTTSTSFGATVRDTTKGENDKIYVGGYGFGAGIENEYGYFIPDYENRRFIFVSDQRREVFLEYTSIGVASDSDMIPVICKPALQAYAMWKDSYFDRYTPMNDQMLKKQVYDEEVDKLRSMYTFTLDDLRDTLNDISTGNPTR